MSNFTFRESSHIGDFEVGEQIKFNLMEWLKWSFLNIGAFNNITRTTYYGQNNKNLSNLIPVNDPRYTDNTVWQGLRTDWVWESGLSYEYQPLQISGIYVNNSFVSSSATGAYAHTISYPEGRVIFATGVLPTNTVQVEHSYRTVQVRDADEPWWHEFHLRSFNADDAQFEQSPGSGGSWNILSQNRIPLPAIVVESVGRINLSPYELGSMNHVHKQDFLLHVVAENSWEMDRIISILAKQQDHYLPTCDFNNIDYPLEHDGSLTDNAKTFPYLCQESPWKKMFISKAVSSDSYERTDKYSNKMNLNKKIYFQTMRYSINGIV